MDTSHSAATVVAAIKVYAFIWILAECVGYYYARWTVSFIQAFGILLFVMGDYLWSYIPFVRRPPELYFIFINNPALAFLVVYVLLPFSFPWEEEWIGEEARAQKFTFASWISSACSIVFKQLASAVQGVQRVQPSEMVKLGLASAGLVMIGVALIQYRHQLRRFFFPALRGGDTPVKLREKGTVGTISSYEENGVRGSEMQRKERSQERQESSRLIRK